MTISKLVLAGFLTLCLNGIAHAGGYVGLDGSSLELDTRLDKDLNPRGMRVRLGMRMDNIFDVEVHLGGGTDRQTSSFDEISAGFAGAFLKAYLPVGQRSALFGLAGFSAVEITQELGFSEFSDTRSGFSYGFGLETELSERLDLSADFVRYIDDDGEFSEISAVSLGIKWYF